MGLKDELAQELESARRDFHHLLDSVPESSYLHPSDNPAWTVGGVLHHITWGPPVLRMEIWLLRHAPWFPRLMLNDVTAKVFHWGNALLTRRPTRITRQSLMEAYEAGHASLISDLRWMREEDFARSAYYPASFVSELEGVVTIERLYRYVRQHFDVHAEQIKEPLNEYQADAPE